MVVYMNCTLEIHVSFRVFVRKKTVSRNEKREVFE